MNKAFTAGLAALTLGVGVLTTAEPAQAWHRGYYHAYYGPGYYRYRRNYGGAVAAGVVGGLALGALAAGAASAAPAYPVEECYWVRRRFVDDWGRVFIRREQVCE